MKAVIGLGLGLLCICSVGACSDSNTSYLVAEPGRPAIVDPSGTPVPGHVPRAQPPVSGSFGTLSSAQSMGPDNRSMAARTGLNSDPTNPNGLAGHPASWNSL